MKINIVFHQIGCEVLERELDIVAFMHDDHRAWNRAVERQGPDLGALAVDHHFLFLDHESDFNDLRPARGDLLVFRQKWRCHHGLLHPRQ